MSERWSYHSLVLVDIWLRHRFSLREDIASNGSVAGSLGAWFLSDANAGMSPGITGQFAIGHFVKIREPSHMREAPFCCGFRNGFTARLAQIVSRAVKSQLAQVVQGCRILEALKCDLKRTHADAGGFRNVFSPNVLSYVGSHVVDGALDLPRDRCSSRASQYG